MQTSPLTIGYAGMQMKYSGLFRCIFTGYPNLWLIRNQSFYFLKFNKPTALVLSGPQGCGKTTLALSLQKDFIKIGYECNVYDNTYSSGGVIYSMYNKNDEDRLMMQRLESINFIDIYCVQEKPSVIRDIKRQVILISLL